MNMRTAAADLLKIHGERRAQCLQRELLPIVQIYVIHKSIVSASAVVVGGLPWRWN